MSYCEAVHAAPSRSGAWRALARALVTCLVATVLLAVFDGSAKAQSPQAALELELNQSTIQYNRDTFFIVSGGSGDGAVTFALTSGSDKCTFVGFGPMVRGTGLGDCTIKATKAADDNYLEATSNEVTVTVTRGLNTIGFGAATPTLPAVGDVWTPVVAGQSDLAVTWTTSSAACNVTTTTVNFVAVGTCEVKFFQSGGAFYNDASLTLSLTVVQGNQSALTAVATPASIAKGETSMLSTIGGSGDGVVSFALTPITDVCSITDNMLTGNKVGSCTITATKPADANYKLATSTPITVTVTGPKTPQTITFTSTLPASPTVGGSYVAAATSDSNLTVSFSTTSTACAVSGSTVTFVSAGMCIVKADQAGDTTYAAAQTAMQSFTIGQGNQSTLTAVAKPSSIVKGETSMLSATGGSGDGVVQFTVTSTPANNCSITNNTLTGINAGSCMVTATKAADANYLVATSTTITVTVTAPKTSQTITFTSTPPASPTVGGSYTVAATSSSGLAVRFLTTSTACAVSGSTVTFSTAGTCTVKADQAGDDTYAAAPTATQSFTIGQGNQSTLTAVATPSSIVKGATSQLSTTGGSGDGVVQFTVTSTPANNCSITNNTLTGINAGSCMVTATKAADANYLVATSTTITVTVGMASQAALTAKATPSSIVYGGTSTLSTTGGSGDGRVSFAVTSNPPNSCSISGNMLTGNKVGSCTVTATKAADTNYSEATSTAITVTVGTAPQASLTAIAMPSTIMLNGTSTLSVKGGSGIGAVTWALAPGQDACSLSGTTVTGIKVGSCKITATKEADDYYSLATASVTLTVSDKKPDPRSDAKVRAIAAYQAVTAQNIVTGASQTVFGRLEALHNEVPTFVNGLSVSSPKDARAYSPVDAMSLADFAKRTPAIAALDRNASPSAAAPRSLFGPSFYLWTSGSISTGIDKIDGLAEKTRSTNQSATVGIDTKLTENLKAGFAIGGYFSSSKYDDNGSKTRARGLTGTVYASLDVGQGVFFDGLLGYGGVTFKSSRNSEYALGSLTGSRDGRMLYGSLSASWERRSGAVKYAPYFRIDMNQTWLDGYAEQGDANWTLAFAKANVSSQALVLGLRAQYDMDIGGATVSPTIRLEYRRTLNGNVEQMLSYVSDPATSYTLLLAGMSRDAFTGTIGLMAKGGGNISGSIEYSAGYSLQGVGFSGQGLRGTLRLGF